MLNRHGLVCGATGTGKTKTLQLMAEQLSVAGVPVFAADMKGDLSGMASAGQSSDSSRHGRPRSARSGRPGPTRWSSLPSADRGWGFRCAPP